MIQNIFIFTVFVQGALLAPVFVLAEEAIADTVQEEEKKVPNFDMLLRPTIDVYASEVANCDVVDLDFSQGLTSVRNICQELMDSPVCEDIHKDYRMDCNDIYLDPENRADFTANKPGSTVVAEAEYELSHGTGGVVGDNLSVLWNCLKGHGQFWANLGEATLGLLQGAFYLTISSFTETEGEKELFDQFQGMKNLYAAEVEKEELKTPAEGRSAFPPVITALWNIIWDGIKTRYWKNFACLSAQGRNKLICEAGTEILALGAGGFFAGGKTLISAAWKGIKTPRATVKAIANKNPLGKAAKQRRQARKQMKADKKTALKESKKARKASKKARKSQKKLAKAIKKRDRSRILRPFTSNTRAAQRVERKRLSGKSAVDKYAESSAKALSAAEKLTPNSRVQKKVLARLKKATSRIEQGKTYLTKMDTKQRKGRIRSAIENRSKNKLAKKTSNKARKDVNKAIQALKAQEKARAKVVGNPSSSKFLERKALAESEAKQALGQARASLEAAKKAAEEAAPGSRTQRLALQKVETAEADLNLIEKSLLRKSVDADAPAPAGQGAAVAQRTDADAPAPAQKPDADVPDQKPDADAPAPAGQGAAVAQRTDADAPAPAQKPDADVPDQKPDANAPAQKPDADAPSTAQRTDADGSQASPDAEALARKQRSERAKRGADTRRRNQEAQKRAVEQQIEVQRNLVENLTGFKAAEEALDKARTDFAKVRGTPEAKSAGGRIGNAKAKYNQAKARRDAIEEAHQVGKNQKGRDGKPAQVRIDKEGKVTGNFTQAQLRRKQEILKNAGFKDAEIRQLMDSGAVGLMQDATSAVRSGVRGIATPDGRKARRTSRRRQKLQGNIDRRRQRQERQDQASVRGQAQQEFQTASQALKEANDNVKNIESQLRQARRTAESTKGLKGISARRNVSQLENQLKTAKASAKSAKDTAEKAREAFSEAGGNPNVVKAVGSVRQRAEAGVQAAGQGARNIKDAAGSGARSVAQGAGNVKDLTVSGVQAARRGAGNIKDLTGSGARSVAQGAGNVKDLTVSGARNVVEGARAVGRGAGDAARNVRSRVRGAAQRVRESTPRRKAARRAEAEAARKAIDKQLQVQSNLVDNLTGLKAAEEALEQARTAFAKAKGTPGAASARGKIGNASRKLNQAKARRSAIERAHQVGRGQIGKDGKPAGIQILSTGRVTGNFTKPQLRQKRKILREAGFNDKEIRDLMQSGAVGIMQDATSAVRSGVRGIATPDGRKARRTSRRRQKLQGNIDRRRQRQERQDQASVRGQAQQEFQTASQALKEANDNVKNIESQLRQARRTAESTKGLKGISARRNVSQLENQLKTAKASAKSAKDTAEKAREAFSEAGGNPNVVKAVGSVRQRAEAGVQAAGQGARNIKDAAGSGARSVAQGAGNVKDLTVSGVQAARRGAGNIKDLTGSGARSVAQGAGNVKDLTVSGARNVVEGARAVGRGAGDAARNVRSRVRGAAQRVREATPRRKAARRAEAEATRKAEEAARKAIDKQLQVQSNLVDNLTGLKAAEEALEQARTAFAKAKGTPGAASARGKIGNASRKLNQAKAKRSAIERAHQVGRGQIGKDGKPAGIQILSTGRVTGNFTKAQLRQKRKILREAGFNDKEIRDLMQSGAVGLMQDAASAVRSGVRGVATPDGRKARRTSRRRQKLQGNIDRRRQRQERQDQASVRGQAQQEFQTASQALKEANDNVKNIESQLRQARRTAESTKGLKGISARRNVSQLENQLKTAKASAKSAKDTAEKAREAFSEAGGNPNVVKAVGSVRQRAEAGVQAAGQGARNIKDAAGSGARSVAQGAGNVKDLTVSGVQAARRGAGNIKDLTGSGARSVAQGAGNVKDLTVSGARNVVEGARAVGRGAGDAARNVRSRVRGAAQRVRESTPRRKAARRAEAEAARKAIDKQLQVQSNLVDNLTGLKAAEEALEQARTAFAKAKGTPGAASARGKIGNASRKLNQAKARRSAIERAHQVGRGQIGKDGKPAGVQIHSNGRVTGNFTKPQLRQKRKILREAGFNDKEIRDLMQSGAVGISPKARQSLQRFKQQRDKFHRSKRVVWNLEERISKLKKKMKNEVGPKTAPIKRGPSKKRMTAELTQLERRLERAKRSVSKSEAKLKATQKQAREDGASYFSTLKDPTDAKITTGAAAYAGGGSWFLYEVFTHPEYGK